MSREKKTRPSVGALGRAEAGVNHEDGNSRNKHITQGPSGQRKVADLLSHGRENAIPRRELEKLTGLDGRTVRLMIERERREGTACVRSMRHRAGEIMKSAQAIEQAER